jgi:hypothetical protein
VLFIANTASEGSSYSWLFHPERREHSGSVDHPNNKWLIWCGLSLRLSHKSHTVLLFLICGGNYWRSLVWVNLGCGPHSSCWHAVWRTDTKEIPEGYP